MSRILNEFGYHHVMSSHSKRDVFLLFASRFIRLFAFGSVAPILILYLRLLGFPDKLVGTFLSLTLLGDVILSLIVTWVADKFGRRNVLALGAVLMGVSGIVFAISDSYLLLLAAAVFGVISPSGNEVGPFSALEVAMLSQLVEPASRVYVLMWYQVSLAPPRLEFFRTCGAHVFFSSQLGFRIHRYCSREFSLWILNCRIRRFRTSSCGCLPCCIHYLWSRRGI